MNKKIILAVLLAIMGVENQLGAATETNETPTPETNETPTPTTAIQIDLDFVVEKLQKTLFGIIEDENFDKDNKLSVNLDPTQKKVYFKFKGVDYNFFEFPAGDKSDIVLLALDGLMDLSLCLSFVGLVDNSITLKQYIAKMTEESYGFPINKLNPKGKLLFLNTIWQFIDKYRSEIGLDTFPEIKRKINSMIAFVQDLMPIQQHDLLNTILRTYGATYQALKDGDNERVYTGNLLDIEKAAEFYKYFDLNENKATLISKLTPSFLTTKIDDKDPKNVADRLRPLLFKAIKGVVDDRDKVVYRKDTYKNRPTGRKFSIVIDDTKEIFAVQDVYEITSTSTRGIFSSTINNYRRVRKFFSNGSEVSTETKNFAGSDSDNLGDQKFLEIKGKHEGKNVTKGLIINHVHNVDDGRTFLISRYLDYLYSRFLRKYSWDYAQYNSLDDKQRLLVLNGLWRTIFLQKDIAPNKVADFNAYVQEIIVFVRKLKIDDKPELKQKLEETIQTYNESKEKINDKKDLLLNLLDPILEYYNALDYEPAESKGTN